MLGARNGTALAALLGSAVVLSGASARAKPKAETKDQAAARLEERAVKTFRAGQSAFAVRILEAAFHGCEPPNGCSGKTMARLHITLGTVKGAGAGDYVGAQEEFALALPLDPEAHLDPTLASPELKAAFE